MISNPDSERRHQPEEKNILFLCTGNAIRSQIAEGLARKLRPDLVFHSAGILASGIQPLTIQVLEETGVDASAQWSKAIGQISIHTIDLVISLCDHAAANCPPFPRTIERIHWSIPDPYRFIGREAETAIAAFRLCRSDVLERLERFFDRRLGEE